MHHINIDIETRSDVDIGKAGVYRYVQSETFAVLLIAYSVDGGRVKVIDVTKGEDESEVRCLLTDPGYRKHAFLSLIHISNPKISIVSCHRES